MCKNYSSAYLGELLSGNEDEGEGNYNLQGKKKHTQKLKRVNQGKIDYQEKENTIIVIMYWV